MQPRYNHYHPFVHLAFYLGILPQAMQQQIPKTTLYAWQNKNQEDLFGYEWFIENKALFGSAQQIEVNKKVVQTNTLLIKCLALRRFIHRHKERLARRFIDIIRVIVQRIKIVSERIGLRACLRLLSIERYEWALLVRTHRCQASLLHRCFMKHPAQLLQREVAVIKQYLVAEGTSHRPLNALYHQMRREGLARFALSTFYKYAARLASNRFHPASRRKNHHRGIRADAPLQLLHIDITRFVSLDGVTSYVYVIQDNYSRYILYAQAFAIQSAKLMKQAVLETIQKYCSGISTIE